MQGIRDERIAKIEGIGILLLMAVVALVVNLWPTPAAPRREPLSRDAGVERASVPVRQTAPHPIPAPPRRGAGHVAPAPAPQFEPAPALDPAAPAVRETLSPPSPSPGLMTMSHLPGTDVDIRPAHQGSATDPPATAEAARRQGAMTRAATTTGKALAVAFRKTGSAVRKVF
jgi:hypothetical protein